MIFSTLFLWVLTIFYHLFKINQVYSWNFHKLWRYAQFKCKMLKCWTECWRIDHLMLSRSVLYIIMQSVFSEEHSCLIKTEQYNSITAELYYGHSWKGYWCLYPLTNIYQISLMYIPLRVRNAEKPLLHNANRNLCIFFRNIAIPKKSAVFRETAIDTLTKIRYNSIWGTFGFCRQFQCRFRLFLS